MLLWNTYPAYSNYNRTKIQHQKGKHINYNCLLRIFWSWIHRCGITSANLSWYRLILSLFCDGRDQKKINIRQNNWAMSTWYIVHVVSIFTVLPTKILVLQVGNTVRPLDKRQQYKIIENIPQTKIYYILFFILLTIQEGRQRLELEGNLADPGGTEGGCACIR